MHIKICGLTNRPDADRAVEAGADYVGCVLVKGTPRYVDADKAREILHGHSGDVTGVLVFRNPTVAEVTNAIRRSGLITVQLHDAKVDVCTTIQQMGIVVHRVIDSTQIDGRLPPDDSDRIQHLDVAGGGTGTTFDWDRTLAPRAPDRVFIAGGLTPDNLAELLRYRPWGVDVSSGIEREVGVKCPELMARFFNVISENAGVES